MNKLKKIIISIAILASIIFTTPKVNADSNYINSKGITIPIEKYNYFKEYFSDSFINNMTQERFNKIKDKEFIKVESQTNYLVYREYYSNTGDVVFTESQSLSEEEYENYSSIQTFRVCTEDEHIDYNECWITENKKLVFDFVCEGSTTTCYLSAELFWLTQPKVRSYDVFAMRWTSNFSPTTFFATQGAMVNSIPEQTEYHPGGTNSVFNSSGVGVSMNLYDDGLWIQCYMDVEGTRTDKKTMTGYVTYQHATSALTLANSKSYTFSSSGLGGVLYYSNSTIRNKYDGMQGLSMNYVMNL